VEMNLLHAVSCLVCAASHNMPRICTATLDVIADVPFASDMKKVSKAVH